MTNAKKRTRFQIDASPELIAVAKEVAAKERVSLTDLVLDALTKLGNPQLSAQIKKEVASKQSPGRPQK